MRIFNLKRNYAAVFIISSKILSSTAVPNEFDLTRQILNGSDNDHMNAAETKKI